MNLDFRSRQAIRGAREYERACRAARSLARPADPATGPAGRAAAVRPSRARRRVAALVGLAIGAGVTLVAAAQAWAKPLPSGALRHEHLRRGIAPVAAHASASASALVLVVASVAAVAVVTLVALMARRSEQHRASAASTLPRRESSRLAA